ncbi:uncharacterized protein TNCV_2816861 [Trichonephila clavipes]|nr:uncharacterized protein TNCV_2816861 [Trichonephila clavipes]
MSSCSLPPPSRPSSRVHLPLQACALPAAQGLNLDNLYHFGDPDQDVMGPGHHERTFEILQNKTQFVRRRDGEKFHSDCVVRTVKHPTKIMIWSVISGKGPGRLDVVKGMMRQDQYKMSCKIARFCSWKKGF